MKKSRETSDSTFAKCLKYLVIGCIAGLFLCAALLAICAFVFVLVKTIPTQAIQAVSKYVLENEDEFICGIFVCKTMPQ